MFKTYNEVVNYLESLQIMPKTMPGLEKIKKALVQTSWYVKIDPNKVIVVAGTNGKGTTSAALEALLLKADQRVGFYSSPHLVRTTERIRFQGVEISEIDFIQIFSECFELIKNCELSHFEALTLMAGHYYFSSNWQLNIDFVIFEVGLGGTYDATNAFPHKYCVITKLGSDHVNILGATLTEIAINKFGVVGKKNIVVHHELPTEVLSLKAQYQKSTNSNWVESEKYQLEVNTDGAQPRYFLTYNNCKFQINILGARAAENIMTAIKTFEILGFDSDKYYSALNEISWQGRMQKVKWPSLNCSMYLSGDHNLQGAQSLIEIVKDFKYNFLHLIVGIGVDKDAASMLELFSSIKNVKLYLTETPFKGIEVEKYSAIYLKKSIMHNKDVSILLREIAHQAGEQDLVLVTGSLYLVGEVLKMISLHPVN